MNIFFIVTNDVFVLIHHLRIFHCHPVKSNPLKVLHNSNKEHHLTQSNLREIWENHLHSSLPCLQKAFTPSPNMLAAMGATIIVEL